MTTIRRDGDEGTGVESTNGGSSAHESRTCSETTQEGLNGADLVVQNVVRAVLERRGVQDWN